ncbi:MAG: hypothetical protein ACM3Y9_12940 [Ignavibacteria bacterium]
MPSKDLPRSLRAALLAAGAAALALGALGGLWRLGWDVPLPGTQPASFHGALAAAAFFGTLVGLEHAAARAARWAYLAPGCAALGGIATMLGAPHEFAAGLLLAGSILLAGLAFGNLRQDRAPHSVIALAGGLCAVGGNALWLAGFTGSQAAGAWLAFLVLNVVAERLELSHLQRPGAAALGLLGAGAALVAGGGALLPWQWRAGAAAAGIGLVCLAFWLLVLDVARRDLRHHRQPRFTALCLVGGYLWLGAGGAMLAFAAPLDGLHDAALHAVFLGFVFAAVMAHAAAILPGLLDVEAPYTPLLYAPLVLLEASLLLRVAGDLLGRAALRDWGGMGNAAALALFVLAAAIAVRRGRDA